MFAEPAEGRTFVIESRSAHDGQPFAAIAELVLLDAAGEPLDATNLRVLAADSEERDREDGSAGNAIDGQTANFWHTEWGAAQPAHPHQLVLDLGGEHNHRRLPLHPAPRPRQRRRPHQGLPHLHRRRPRPMTAAGLRCFTPSA